MAFISTPNSIQLCFDFVTASQLWQFCLVFKKIAGILAPADLTTMSGIGSAWWTSDLAAVMTTDNVLRQVRATDVSIEGGGVSTATVGTAGAIAPPMLPLGTPIVVSLRTLKRGRSYRGRVYLSGVAEANRSSPTDLTAGFAGITLPARFAALQANAFAAGFDMSVASKQHNGLPTIPAEVNKVVAFVIDTHLDSQRRRLAGRGT